jgi:hypothetical protein
MKWIFFEEGKESEPEFEIEADNFEEAFDRAYSYYGPQVDDLYYKEKYSLMYKEKESVGSDKPNQN